MVTLRDVSVNRDYREDGHMSLPQRITPAFLIAAGAVLVEGHALPARRAVGVRRGDDQLADPGGCAKRDRVRHETAEAEAEEIGLGDPEMVEQRDNVTAQRLDRHRAVTVGGVPVALE